ncbi:MAG: seg [candidate division WS6 bacterium 34_10]|uniref:Seg n=1 Tax=candidate division WS6 bacterium 34_10 TaxID=1641389 RepID=A0A117M0H6_9BACT|nr:MAG: seg [candidate division WS6 bacterium 34_10]
METKSTNAFQKLSISIINTFFIALLSLPFYFIFGFNITYKIILVLLFLLYNLSFIFLTKNRCLGMILLGVYWREEYPIKQQIIYAFLYSLSFSTIVIWIFFPFDLLLFNLLLIQLPCVLKTGTTLHGYLSGRMSGYKK